MTPQEIAQEIDALLAANGYAMQLAIVLSKSQLNVTALVAEQFDFVPAVQLAKLPTPPQAEAQPSGGDL